MLNFSQFRKRFNPKPLHYAVLLLIACSGLFILGLQKIPVSFHGGVPLWDLQALYWQLFLGAIMLGLVSVRIAGRLFIVPLVYLAFIIITLSFGEIRVAAQLFDCGMLALLFTLSALLCYRADLGYVLAAVYVRCFCHWYGFLLLLSVPNHAEAFINAVTACVGVAGLMAVGAGLSVLFDWWEERISRFVGAFLLNVALIYYFYYDLVYWINRFLDEV